MHGGDIYNNSVDIDFSVNLNPYVSSGISRIIKEAFEEGLALSCFYPNIDQMKLRRSLAAACGVDIENVFGGCGSSEIFMALVSMISPKRALLTEPCYGGYDHAIKSARDCRIDRYVLKEDNGFAHTADVTEAITPGTDAVFIADPANPTGNNIDEDVLEKILRRADETGTNVILDQSFFMLSEKYLKCTHEYMRKMIDIHENLFIVRSFTKCFALPGIRMGYVISRPDNVKQLRNHFPEWNLPSVSEALMRRLSEATSDGSFFRDSIKMISAERKYLSDELSRIGIKIFPSDTNFILIKTEKSIFEKLLNERILIRCCDDYHGLDDNFYRIAVRDHEDNKKLIDVISSIV